MKANFVKYIGEFVAEFASYYHQYRAKSEQLSSVKYRIITSLAEFNIKKKIELAFTDRPGDILLPMTVNKIKSTPDVIAGMHPIDVNSINDIYYLARDKIVEIRVFENQIIATDNHGKSFTYNVSDKINPDHLKSTRLSYMIGYMQAEQLLCNTFKDRPIYKITRDNITTLSVEEVETGKTFLKQPKDILFSTEYKKFSKDDIAKIGFICGQMSQLQ